MNNELNFKPTMRMEKHMVIHENIDETRKKVVDLIVVFQTSIIELTDRLEEEKSTMAQADIENTHYVIGMVTLNSFNLEEIATKPDDYYLANKDKLNRFLAWASNFAKALKRRGFGKNADLSI